MSRRSSILSTPFILATLVLCSLGNVCADDELKGIVPVKLETLFAVLPEKVEGWKLIQSRGWRGRSRWLESVVTRKFEFIKPESKEGTAHPEVKISIKDTAKFDEGDMALFSDFPPGVEGAVERLYIDSIPAILIEKENRAFSQYLLEQRFILTISFANHSGEELRKWFEKVDTKSLSDVKDGPIVGLPAAFVNQTIDQITGEKRGFVSGVGEVSEEVEGVDDEEQKEEPEK